MCAGRSPSVARLVLPFWPLSQPLFVLRRVGVTRRPECGGSGVLRERKDLFFPQLCGIFRLIDWNKLVLGGEKVVFLGLKARPLWRHLLRLRFGPGNVFSLLFLRFCPFWNCFVSLSGGGSDVPPFSKEKRGGFELANCSIRLRKLTYHRGGSQARGGEIKQ
ncbi:hypothetical protein Cni_G27803 [Canna indica]|uniref:Uncharacterized protein n=1 Tax=Canna indica TaxID=4628 RepID=A0AAQ3QRS3_9LILI|nr:hypothetical protein Cni_G27803 [Canna indica]